MSATNTSLGRALLAVVCFGVISWSGRTAHATLGGDVASIAINHQHLGGEQRVLKLASGERHELQLPSGIVVHQYVSSTGAVYAIAWSGPRMPDLRELLGTYFPKMAQARRLPTGGHTIMVREGDDLVVQSTGHHGRFVGRAWVPSLAPAGVNLDSSLN
jgi:hypothetical protein